MKYQQTLKIKKEVSNKEDKNNKKEDEIALEPISIVLVILWQIFKPILYNAWFGKLMVL